MEVLSDVEFDLLSPSEQVEYLDLWERRLSELPVWRLSGRQQAAEGLSLEVDELLYGGSAGGGKSEWLLWHVLELARKHDGWHGLVLRSSFPELRRTLIRRSVERFAELPVGERPVWRAADKEWRFPNGSVIEFGYCESDDDVRQFLSAEYDCIALDEATEFTDYQASMLRSRCRTTARKRARGIRPHMVLCSNPGGRGHKWVKERYVDPTGASEGTATIVTRLDDGRETSRTVGFVPATAYDNPHIDPAYIENLLQLPEALRKQYLEGSWDSFEGMYFEEFERDLIDPKTGERTPWHVVPDFPIPAHWPRTRGMDYGYVQPYGAVWLTRDPDTGFEYVYRVQKHSGLTVSDQARTILAADKLSDGRPEKIDWTMLDPSCWRRDGAGASISQQLAQSGLRCRKADNRRIDGWIAIRERLQASTIETPDGPYTAPGLRIFASCEPLIDEFALAMRDKNNGEDLDKKPHNDHLLDALRYCVMAQPAKARKPPASPVSKAQRTMARWESKIVNRNKRGPRPLGL